MVISLGVIESEVKWARDWDAEPDRRVYYFDLEERILDWLSVEPLCAQLQTCDHLS